MTIYFFSIAANAEHSSKPSWNKDLKNGYITTSPLIVEDQVFVRTSGFWTGTDRPHVYSFDLESGEENWRFKSNTSVQHDMSPILYVEASSGDCGSWDNLLVIGWTDGKITALNSTTGGLVWEFQTEVVTWGITGEMGLDGDAVVVPTRQGLTVLCLADGSEKLRVDLDELGWRNGVTVTEESYLLGNENGILKSISKEGEITNLSEFDGKIRHKPVVTQQGILIHLQTINGSSIYIGQNLLSQEGHSPAIPLQVESKVYLGTSSHIIEIDCEEDCQISQKNEFKCNGEISKIYYNSKDLVVFPSNEKTGGWAFGIENFELKFQDIGTYTTAGISSNNNGVIALGNDNGVLFVQFDESISVDDNESTLLAKTIVLFLSILIFPFVFKHNPKLGINLGVLCALVVLILVTPAFSNYWSQKVDSLQNQNEDWDDDWPDSWRGTQVVVIELENEQIVVGGLEGYQTVEEITDFVTEEKGITVEKETYNFGSWIISFDGQSGEGWEFTIDGVRSNVGMSESKIDEDSVVRWLPA